MKCGARVAMGVAGGYFLGRTKKMKLALMLGGMAAGRQAGGPGELLAQGSKLLGRSPELTQLVDQVRGRLLEAGKVAAVAAATRQVEGLTERVGRRVESLGDVAGGRPGDKSDSEPAETDEAEPEEAEESAEADEADEAPTAESEEPEATEPAEDEEPEPSTRRSARAGGGSGRRGTTAALDRADTTKRAAGRAGRSTGRAAAGTATRSASKTAGKAAGTTRKSTRSTRGRRNDDG